MFDDLQHGRVLPPHTQKDVTFCYALSFDQIPKDLKRSTIPAMKSSPIQTFLSFYLCLALTFLANKDALVSNYRSLVPTTTYEVDMCFRRFLQYISMNSLFFTIAMQ
jgi:hypothetical protein